MKTFQREIPPFLITTDKSKMDFDFVYSFIRTSYWAMNIPRPIFDKSMENSLCFGVFESHEQVAFARVVSDYSTFAFLGDVFVDPNHRSKGISKILMECLLAHPELEGLRRFCLGTKDAHSLYQKFGFQTLKEPENWMEIKNNQIYK